MNAGNTCAPVTDYATYANRLITIGALTTVDTWGSCGTCAVSISGCTDPLATNYDPTATVDDGSCLYSSVLTITTTVCSSATSVALTGPWWGWDPTAGPTAVDNGNGTWTFTLDPAPTADMEYLLVVDGVQEDLVAAGTASGDWSCTPITDYFSYANRQWVVGSGNVTNTYNTCGTCAVSISGCTDPLATNYDPTATVDDGSCLYSSVLTITTTVCSSATSVALTGPWWGWDPTAGPTAVDNGNGTWTFTLDPAPTADMEYLLVVDGVQEDLVAAGTASGDWSCTPITDYFSYANRQWVVGSGNVTNTYNTCGTCAVSISGCTDPLATNYDPTATVDDGSCLYGPILTQIDLPVTWDDNTVDYTVTPFGGTTASLVADPTNASNTVLEVDRTAGSPTWAGTTLGTNSGFATDIPLTLSNSTMSVSVWSPQAGTPIRLKVEDSNDPTHTCETEVNTTASGWQVLVFDFSNEAPGTQPLSVGLGFGWTFNKASVFCDFGNVPSASTLYYLDDVTFGGVVSNVSGCTDPLATNYDPTATVDDGSCLYSSVLTITTTVCSSATSVALTGPWWGWDPTAGPTAVDNGNGTWTFTLDPAPTADMEYLLVVDGVQEDLVAAGTASGDWSCTPITDYFSYANRQWVVGSGNVTNTYNTCGTCAVSISGCTDPSATNYDPTATVDDGSCLYGPILTQIDLPVTWDDNTVDYTVTPFGGTTASLVADPTNASNTVLEVDRTAGSPTWAGTTLGTNSGFATDIPLTLSNSTMSVSVWSPQAGTPIRLKVEDSNDPTHTCETEVNTTASGWQVLVFDFSNEAPGTQPLSIGLGFGWTFNKASVFCDFGNVPSASTLYYLDDVTFGGVVSNVSGCTDPLATNYDPTATVDDGSCLYSSVLTITTTVCSSATSVALTGPWWGWDPTAGPTAVDNGNGTWTFTLDPAPTADMEYLLVVDGVQEDLVAAGTASGDWSCTPITDYFSYANRQWVVGSGNVTNTYNTCGTCAVSISGCTDPSATNYDPTATVDDGSCLYGPILTQIDLPVTWDDNTVDYTVTPFGGTTASLVADPTNASNTVLEVDRTAGSPTWAGTTLGTNSGFATDIPLTLSNSTMSVSVWSPQAGTPIRLKVEDSNDPTHTCETEVNTTASGWQVLVFDFSNEAPGTQPLSIGLGFGWTFNKASVFCDFGNVPSASTLYYLDDVTFGGVVSNVSGCTDPLATNYDPTATVDDGSCLYSSVLTITTTVCSSATSVALTGPWWGWDPTAGPTAVDNGNGTWTFTLDPAPTADMEYLLVVDGVQEDLVAAGTASGDWSCTPITDYFSYANRQWVVGSGNVTNTYNTCGTCAVSISGCTDPTATNYDPTATVDDGSCLYGPILTQIDLPVTWDDNTVDYTVTPFGGTTASLVADPTNASNTVLEVDRTAGSPTWAGTTLGTNSGFATDIPLTLSNSTMSVSVWSPQAGTPIRLKVEDSNDPTHTCETEVNTTASGWQVLVFDFSNEAPGTQPLSIGLGFGWTFNKASVFCDFGNVPSASTLYYLDDVTFGGVVSNVSGCTDPLATNYDPTATVDDGSCLYSSVLTITTTVCSSATSVALTGPWWGWDPTAGPTAVDNGNGTWTFTLDPAPTADMEYLLVVDGVQEDLVAAGTASGDWSCTPITDYFSYANRQWVVGSGNVTNTYNTCGTCAVSISGCTDPTATNYDPTATVDDGSCIASVYGCTDATACNYYAGANVDDGSCEWTSCNPTTCGASPITGLGVTNVVHNRVTLTFDNMNTYDASGAQLCRVDQLRIKYREVGTSTWSQKNMAAPTGYDPTTGICNSTQNTDKLVLGLTGSTTYEWEMRVWYCATGATAWVVGPNFTTAINCPDAGNLAVTSGSSTQATFTWDDSNGAYSFVRLQAKVDATGTSFFNIGGIGVNYGTFTKNKNGLVPGESYRAKSRTWCDPNGGAYKALSWTSFIYWTQPGSIRVEGGSAINNLAVYPNPSRDVFNVTFTSEDVQNLEVRVLNVVGEVVYTENLEQFVGEYTKAIDLATYTKGVYFLEITTNTGVVNKKLILQ